MKIYSVCFFLMCLFVTTSYAITIKNDNKYSVDYIITVKLGLIECAKGNIGKHGLINWTASNFNPLCQNPSSIYVHVQGLSSATGEYCGGAGGKNKIPRSIKNIGNVATVQNAGFMRGIKCTTSN